MIDQSFEIFLRLLFHVADFIKPVEVICFVTKLDLSVHMIVKGSHHDPVECVFRMITDYCLSIVECELFVANLVNINRGHGKLDSAFIMSRNSVPSIWPIYEIMGDRRVM